MSKFKSKLVSEFSLEGRFLSFVFEDGYKLKGLRLASAEGECCIKLCKELRADLELRLIPGDWVQVVGEKKLNLKTGKLKLKAEQVISAVDKREQISPSREQGEKKGRLGVKKASILVCQKSDCMKRGGKAVCQALQAELSDRGLEDRVTIKGTGCFKECSSGPNLVVMPDKTRYSRIQAAQISELVDKHYSHPERR